MLAFRSQRFGLTPKKGLVLGVLLCLDSMLLPWALKRQWALAWFVLSILGILASATWLSREEAVQADKLAPSDGADGVRADGVSADGESADEVSADGVSVNGAEVRIKGLEELLDSGFAAKQAGQFALAAQCFEEALKLSPEPDLVISLLADIYWLWKAVRGEEMARVQLQVLWDQHKGMPGGAENFISYLGG